MASPPATVPVPSGPIATAPTPSAAATATATTLPAGTPPPPCDTGVICDGGSMTGTYTTHSLDITVGFTLTGDGWIGGGDENLDGFRISRGDVGGSHAIAVTGWGRKWATDPCLPFGTTGVDATVAAFATRLTGTAGIVVEGESVSRTVADWPATQVDLTVASQCPDAGTLYPWTSEAGHRYELADGLRARVIAFRVELPRTLGLVPLVKFIVVVVEAGPGADLELLLQKADELLETLTIAL